MLTRTNNTLIDEALSENTAIMHGEIADKSGIGFKAAGVTKEFLLEHVNDQLGYRICTLRDDDMQKLARKASTICRRSFKPQDVVLISVLDEEEDGNAGIAFTTDGIFVWEEGDSFEIGIRYNEIKAVDYDYNGVKLYTYGQDTESTHKVFGLGILQLAGNCGMHSIRCVCSEFGFDEEEELEYIREMYNFISDIVEEVNAS